MVAGPSARGVDRLVVAAGRGQLLLVGFALKLVLDPSQPLVWSWVWVAAMLVFAAFTVRRRAPEVPSIFGLALAAEVAVAAVSLGVIFGFHMFPLQGATLIPLAGMMIGNSMSATVVAARRVVGELRDKRSEVEARLALGHPWPAASKPYVRGALRTAMIPRSSRPRPSAWCSCPGR